MSDSPTGDSYHHGDLRNAMIAAAQQILSEEGALQVTFRRLSRDLSVSHNAPYRHFKNQTALFAVISQRGYEQLRDHLENAVRAAPNNTPAQLIAFARSYGLFAVANPNLYRLMFTREVITTDEEGEQDDLDKTFHHAAAALIDVFAQGQREGHLRPHDAARQALTFWAMVHGLAMLWIDEQAAPYFVARDEAAETAVTTVVQILLDGIEKG